MWQEQRVDTTTEEAPDSKIKNEESTIKSLYDKIEDKIRGVKKKVTEDEKDSDEELEEYQVTCLKCEEEFTLKFDEDDDLKEGVAVKCPHCSKKVTFHEEDI